MPFYAHTIRNMLIINKNLWDFHEMEMHCRPACVTVGLNEGEAAVLDDPVAIEFLQRITGSRKF